MGLEVATRCSSVVAGPTIVGRNIGPRLCRYLQHGNMPGVALGLNVTWAYGLTTLDRLLNTDTSPEMRHLSFLEKSLGTGGRCNFSQFECDLVAGGARIAAADEVGI